MPLFTAIRSLQFSRHAARLISEYCIFSLTWVTYSVINASKSLFFHEPRVKILFLTIKTESILIRSLVKFYPLTRSLKTAQKVPMLLFGWTCTMWELRIHPLTGTTILPLHLQSTLQIHQCTDIHPLEIQNSNKLFKYQPCNSRFPNISRTQNSLIFPWRSFKIPW